MLAGSLRGLTSDFTRICNLTQTWASLPSSFLICKILFLYREQPGVFTFFSFALRWRGRTRFGPWFPRSYWPLAPSYEDVFFSWCASGWVFLIITPSCVCVLLRASLDQEAQKYSHVLLWRVTDACRAPLSASVHVSDVFRSFSAQFSITRKHPVFKFFPDVQELSDWYRLNTDASIWSINKQVRSSDTALIWCSLISWHIVLYIKFIDSVFLSAAKTLRKLWKLPAAWHRVV